LCYSGHKALKEESFVSRIIPTPVIAVAAQVLETHFTHTQIDTLMESLGVAGPPPIGNKVDKLRAWLRNANGDPDPRSDALRTLGKVLEEFMEVDPPYGPHQTQIDGRKRMEDKLREYGLTYIKGGKILASGGVAVSPSVTVPRQIQIPQVINPDHRQQHFVDTRPTQNSKVFIGHGHSQVWRELKDFLQDRLGLRCEEFNSESAAGTSTTSRLEAMMDKANFAFVIMTAEDERVDGTLHARENVIHEAGLFQGRLGFKRSIILKEEGCQELSNIRGLTHIPFPRNRISAAFEDIRKVLEREGIITTK
jgi:predicted nucleotide-binding protein